MTIKRVFLLISCFVLFCESAFVDHLEKCGIDDGECQRDLLQSVLRDIGKTGIPDYGIPAADPYALKDVTVSILNMVNITMVDGVAKGAKDCIIKKVVTNIEDRLTTMELTCDLTIKGKYKVFGSSPLISNVLGGGNVHGEGNTKVKIEKMDVKFDYHFTVRKGDDGENYINADVNDLKYTYTLGKVTISADNIYIGENESSGLIIPMLNQNWKLVMQNFGKPFLDKAMEVISSNVRKFFDVVPTKYYITDDLSQYVK